MENAERFGQTLAPCPRSQIWTVPTSQPSAMQSLITTLSAVADPLHVFQATQKALPSVPAPHQGLQQDLHVELDKACCKVLVRYGRELERRSSKLLFKLPPAHREWSERRLAPEGKPHLLNFPTVLQAIRLQHTNRLLERAK